MYFQTKINFPKTHFGSLEKCIFLAFIHSCIWSEAPRSYAFFLKKEKKKTWVINAAHLYTCIHNFILPGFWQNVVSANFFRAGCP